MTGNRQPTPIRQRLTAAGAVRNTATHLPADCPVTVLGGDGRSFWYINAIGQLVTLEAQQHSKNNIMALFAPHIRTWLFANYPKTFDDDTGQPRDFRLNDVTTALMEQAQERGRAWEPADNIHGRGVWAGADGDLRIHLGSKLIVGGKDKPVGLIGNHVYPLCPEWEGPVPDAQAGGPAGPAAETLALLGCWRWAEPELAPRLLLGWIICAFLCGALEWRPHLWLVAPRGAGKSTLLRAVGDMLQRGAFLLAAESASAPSVRATLRYDARPVMLDETEPSEDNRALNQVVELLRLASTGGTVMRAQVDQSTVTQTVRFVAMCASVVRPALKSQDASRIAMLQLLKPLPGTAAPVLRASVLELLGRRLLRRALDGWKAWPDTLGAWRAALSARGLEARAQDQFGTLLAAAWIAQHDVPPDSDTLDEWADRVVQATVSDRAEERPEWFRLIETLSATPLKDDATRAERSVAQLLEIASQARREPDEETNGWTYISEVTADKANALLALHGLRFWPLRDEASGRPLRQHWDRPDLPPSAQLATGPMLGHVAVANAHPILARLLERTQWAARAGAPGAWKGVLMQAPGAQHADSIRFGPRTARCVLVPLELFFDGVSPHD
jgi:hypothetical protein